MMVNILKSGGIPVIAGLKPDAARLTGSSFKTAMVSMQAMIPWRAFPSKNTPYRLLVPFIIPMTWVCTENPANPQIKETRESCTITGELTVKAMALDPEAISMIPLSRAEMVFPARLPGRIAESALATRLKNPVLCMSSDSTANSTI